MRGAAAMPPRGRARARSCSRRRRRQRALQAACRRACGGAPPALLPAPAPWNAGVCARGRRGGRGGRRFAPASGGGGAPPCFLARCSRRGAGGAFRPPRHMTRPQRRTGRATAGAEGWGPRAPARGAPERSGGAARARGGAPSPRSGRARGPGVARARSPVLLMQRVVGSWRRRACGERVARARCRAGQGARGVRNAPPCAARACTWSRRSAARSDARWCRAGGRGALAGELHGAGRCACGAVWRGAPHGGARGVRNAPPCAARACTWSRRSAARSDARWCRAGGRGALAGELHGAGRCACGAVWRGAPHGGARGVRNAPPCAARACCRCRRSAARSDARWCRAGGARSARRRAARSWPACRRRSVARSAARWCARRAQRAAGRREGVLQVSAERSAQRCAVVRAGGARSARRRAARCRPACRRRWVTRGGGGGVLAPPGAEIASESFDFCGSAWSAAVLCQSGLGRG